MRLNSGVSFHHMGDLMAFGVDLDALLAAVDELSARARGSRGNFLLDYGLALHDRLERWTYSSTPVNSVTFASTGGDGVHFGLLQSASTTGRDGPVVMTVPAARRANHVVAGSIREFLGLGCIHGWFFLEQLAYRPADAFERYARADPPSAAPISQLFERLSLSPRALQPNRLEELSRQYGDSIVLAPPESTPPKSSDLDAFLAWKRSKYKA
jgi:hypothetical protein